MMRTARQEAVSVMMPPPVELGLPAKFRGWRPKQAEAVIAAIECDKRFPVMCMPTGSGKSLTYMAVAAMTGYRTLILTSTKGLQDQLISDFTEMGAFDVRGMANYPCEYEIAKDKLAGKIVKIDMFNRFKDGTPTCDIGPCLGGMKCQFRDDGKCHYFSAVAAAAQSKVVITNYAYWMAVNQRADVDERKGLGKFDLLVLDEAHDAPEQLGNYLGVEVTMNQVEGLLHKEWPRDHSDWERWRSWAKEMAKVAAGVAAELEDDVKGGVATRGQLKDFKEASRLASNLARIGEAKGTAWVTHMARVGRNKHLTLHLDPVWPGEYAEKHLFCAIPHIILTSATIRPKTLDLLGIIDGKDVSFVEYPSTFPVERRPVMWVPTIRVDKRTTNDEMRIWVAKIDQIIGKRLDRKGIIHTVSYARVDLIKQWSKYRDIMFTHETATTRDVVADFKKAAAPAVLVSPSMATGWDFPYDECRYQIIGKLPFPDSRDLIVKARTQIDPAYAYYITMQVLVQASGRGMRAEDDVCETFIIDDHAAWFIGKWGKTLAPAWFKQAYRVQRGVPDAVKI